MTDIEIPQPADRHWKYRIFEILPGALSWSILLLPFILSFVNVTAAAFFVLTYMIIWNIRNFGVNIRALQGYKRMAQHQKLDWTSMIMELETGKLNSEIVRPQWHYRAVARLQATPSPVKPSELIHVAMVATVKESQEVLEPTIQSVLASEYDMKKVIFVLAYEERGGTETEQRATELVAKYKDKFLHAMAVKHPENIPGEIIGKGGNVTYAGRALQVYLEEQGIDPLRVVVTTLDADNRPHKKYFAALSYTYVACGDPVHISFQPIPMYTNNIWDAPAPMRVVATGNSFWNVMLSLRPHMLRNFSSHAQSMQTLLDTDFWSVRTIVEDGHQFWRTYFRYDGRHEVYPIYVPIYQDAVFTGKYLRTLKAQFLQLRRWTWGASDVAYIITEGYFKKNNVPKRDLTFKLLRSLEGHVNWAVGPPLLAFSAFIPALFNSSSYAANVLPFIVSRIQTVALVGILATLFVSLKTLPPRPARYKRRRNLWLILQWAYLPVMTLCFAATAALYSQTRLMFGWYIGKFDVTEKAVAKADHTTVT